MAQKRRVRSRTTPQPGLPRQLQSARTTRSQSRDIDAQPTHRDAGTSRRNARGPSVESFGSTDTDTGRAMRHTSRRAAGRNLSTVEEDVTVQYPNIDQAIEEAEEVDEDDEDDEDDEESEDYDEEDDDDDDDDDEEDEQAVGSGHATPPPSHVPNDFLVHETPGGQSSVSATTAISTAQTIHDPADLDNDSMIEFLDDLYNDSSKIMNILAPKAASTERLAFIASEAINAESKTRRLLTKRAEHFKQVCENFGDGEFINVDTVTTSLGNGEPAHESGVQQLDAVLYMANVAAFANRIATLPNDRSAVHESLLSLDNTFPRNLIDSSKLGGGSLAEETFQLALDIRTQFATSLLTKAAAYESSDPDALLCSVFFPVPDEDEEGSTMFRLRGWESLGLGLGDDDLPDPIKSAVKERIKKIRESFRENQEALREGDYVDAEKLESNFPWHDFVVSVLKWASSCRVKLDQNIDSHGGIQTIQELLQQSLEAGDARSTKQGGGAESQNQDDSTLEMDSQGRHIPKTDVGVARMWKRRWASFEAKEIGVAEDPKDSNGPTPNAAEDEYQSPVYDEEEDPAMPAVPSVGRSAAQDDLEILRQRERQNKENMRRTTTNPNGSAPRSFYEKQKGATRVSWDEPEASFATETASSYKSQQKRRRSESESDEDEFEARVSNNKRQAPVERKARYSPGSTPPPSNPTRGQSSRQAAARATNVRPEESDGDDDGDGDGDGDAALPSAARQLQAVNRQARVVSSTFRTNGAKGRRPWSEAEVNALMELIAEFGHTTRPWIQIKQADAAGDNFLAHRSNVDLKDKAINIICTHKMAGQAPPPGFEFFKLPASLQAKVDSRRGILSEDT